MQHNTVEVIAMTVRYQDGKSIEWIVQKRRQRNKSARKKLLGVEIVQVQGRPTTQKRLIESFLGASANKATNLLLVSWNWPCQARRKEEKMLITYP